MDLAIESPWTWEEYNILLAEVFPILKTLGKPCAVTVDVTRFGKLPPGNALSYLSRAEKLMPINLFASVIVGAPYIVSMFIDIMTRTRPHPRHATLFAKTMPEAHEKILATYHQLYPSQSKRNS
jgi:hypothetical protein